MHQPLTDAEECSNSTCNTETHLKDQTVRPRHLIKSQFESLPQELIVEIFKYCRENAVSDEHSPKAVKLREMIQNLRQVCFRWNHIMENTPAMWSYIIIGNGRQEVLPPFLAWTRRSVSLSKNTTLNIEVDYPNSTLESHGEIMEAMKDVLLPEIHRWGICRLYYDPAYIRPHLELFKKPAPRLEVFEASADQDHLSKIVHITNLFDNHAPRLHNLFIPTLAISWNSPLLMNLTYLCIFAKNGEGTPMEDQYHRILTSNPQLEYLRIEGENGVFIEPGLDFQFDVLMPKLGMLNLEFLPHRTCRSILSSIRSEAWCDIGLRYLSGNPFVGLENAPFSRQVLRRKNLILRIESEKDGLDEGESDYTISVQFGSFGRLWWQSPFHELTKEVILTLVSKPYELDIGYLSLRETDELFEYEEILTIKQLFEKLPEVKVFQAAGCWRWMRALLEPHPRPEDPSSFHWLLPKITHLAIMEPGLLIVLLESRYTGQEESDSCSPPADLEVLGFSSKRDESGNARKQIIGIVGEDVYLTMDSGFESYTSFWRTFVH